MRTESLLNKKEYLHFVFLISVFCFSAFFFDLNSAVQRAQSTLLIGFIGAMYIIKMRMSIQSFSYWNFEDETKTTDYEIVGPFGFVLIVAWLALIDIMTPEVISKYTGLLILLTIISALHINSKITKRGETRLVLLSSVRIHQFSLAGFFLVLYAIATRYFLMFGTWDWDIPDLDELFQIALGIR